MPCEAVNVKPKRHWRFQDVGVAGIIGQPLRKSTGIKHSRFKRQAVCAAGSRTGEMWLSTPLGTQVKLSKKSTVIHIVAVFGVCPGMFSPGKGSHALGIKTKIT